MDISLNTALVRPMAHEFSEKATRGRRKKIFTWKRRTRRLQSFLFILILLHDHHHHHTINLNHPLFNLAIQSFQPNMDIVFNQHANGTFDIEYFQYTPSKEAGLAFVAIFAAATAAHVGYMFFFRAWSFIPMILGGICMSTALTSFSHTTSLACISSPLRSS